MTVKDPELRAHQEWLGYVQPVGLVVSPHALHRAQAFVAKGILPEHARFLALVKEVPVAGSDEPIQALTDLPAFATSVLGWESRDLIGQLGGEPIPDDLKVPLTEYGETLTPTYAVTDPEPQGESAARWQMLVQTLSLATPLDDPLTKDELRWHASPQARIERLLRETGVPTGLLSNGVELRLVYAPQGESSGHATFRVDHMCEVAGRPIFAALHMLLGSALLFTNPRRQRLPHILSESRKYQNEVSTALAEQVLHALYEMLRGFQRANDESKSQLLRDVLREDPNHVYNGLLTVLLRMIFVLYAEERGLLSSDPVYVNHYSVLGLFERLRADNDRNQDTMDHRYGAWAQLLTLFRLIHDGGSHGSLRLPPRHGHLFNPDRFNFLEGRPRRIGRVMGDRIEPPAISDGVIYRVLSKLLLLDGERISYRSLDVEQIGSVYEVMMGFTLDLASGTSIAIKPKKALGAPSIVNLEELLAVAAEDRSTWLRERTDQELTGEALAALSKAATIDDLAVSLATRVAREATPSPLPKGSMILQSSESRRRSGSNYTPRSLTEPIVRKTLEPILRDIGELPKPEQILALKICDPAMGSGAFLVETCRQLGDALVKAWHAHAQLPKIPPDEDEVLHARRLVAQRCLYGVDKNPIAADLAKLSLWLATLAKDHPFTFLDHALRVGDSLVGLTRAQIEGFHWHPTKQLELVRSTIASRLAEATELRARIQAGSDELGYDARRLLLKDADEALDDVRLVGDLVVCALFEAGSPRARELLRLELAVRADTFLKTRENLNDVRSRVDGLRTGEKGVIPFHWEIEFPEVFERENQGFDVIVANPPFLGGRKLSTVLTPAYAEAIRALILSTKGTVNLLGYFLIQISRLTRREGHFGLLATSSVLEGETRAVALRPLLLGQCTINWARSKAPWPGEAGVYIVQLSLTNGTSSGLASLDGQAVDHINSRLEARAEPPDPVSLAANRPLHSDGIKVQGIGFVLSEEEANELLGDDRNRAVIQRYVTGDDLNSLADASGSRWVINFRDMSEAEARSFRSCFRILEERVRPYRDGLTRQVHETCFWKFWDRREEFFERCSHLQRLIVMSKLSKYRAATFGPIGHVYSEKVKVFASDEPALLGLLQSQVHELWSLREGATTGETPAYSGTKCFDTFALPREATFGAIRVSSVECYERREVYRASCGLGLTDFYNRFHDPGERDPEFVKLRALHVAVDRVVLDSYGWSDISTTCEFIPDVTEPADDGNEIPKSVRYRWPDEVRDEVLARLLTLNAERAEEERLLAASAEPAPKPRRSPPKMGGGPSTTLFAD